METTVKVFNEYLDKAQEYLDCNVLYDYQMRHELTSQYSWAIPNTDAILEIVEHSPIIEIGAGTGYWAKLISEFGGDIICYDTHPYKNEWCDNKFFDVNEGDQHSVKLHPDRTLFLCWTPYGDELDYEALMNYTGNILIVVGEDMNGCTGSERFHNEIDDNWSLRKTINIPRWNGIYDSMKVYQR